MKRKTLWLLNNLVAAAAVLAAPNSQAWHICGTVLCPNGTPYPGAVISVCGTSCCTCGTFSTTGTVDTNGNYYIPLPDCNGSYTACLNISTLPAGATLESPDCVSFSLTSSQDIVSNDWVVCSSICQTPPPPPPGCTPVSSCIRANFNGTPVAENDFIWFNSVVKVQGHNIPGTLTFDSSTISFVVDGTPVTVDVPPATIQFSTSATTASTTFQGGAWLTIVPASYNGNIFLSGVSYQLPFNLPGGVQNVDWCGDFSANTPSVQIQWQWASAAYSYPCAASPSGYNGIEVKPIDGPQQNPYNNGDHAGTPEYSGNTCVIGGAMGGGGSNWTGSYSGTVSANLCTGVPTN
jgi:hypothetical protein